jgi:protein-tyrosine phosphatase
LDDAERDKIKMIMDEVYPDDVLSVPDPYFDDDGFEQVFKMLDEACDQIIERYSKTH